MKKGKYQHYKGNFYEVIGLARHSETLEELVMYRALYESDAQKLKISGTTDGGFGEHVLWVRPKKMFLEMVEIDGKQIPRFSFVE